MHIIPLSKAEFAYHSNEAAHTYRYYRIGDALLEVVSTPKGIIKASFVTQVPEGTIYASLDALKDIPLLLTGTPFQIKVLQAAAAIPAGSTVTYQELANKIGHPRTYRAVGSALANNTIAYLIPCHRVVKKDGDKGNYRWGREIKEMLLKIEADSTKS